MRLVVLLVTSLMGAVPLWPQKAGAAANPRAAVLKKFLQDHLQQLLSRFSLAEIDEGDRFSYAFIDLNGDGKDEAIIYLTGRGWCGTGGCQLYIATPDGTSYRFVARIPATRPPIRVLNKFSHGWRSVSVLIREDASRMYEGEFRFNGEKYPLGDRPLRGQVPGRVVISGEREEPLYP